MRAVVLSVLVISAFLVSGCLGGDDLEDGDEVMVEAVDPLAPSIETAAAGTWLAPGESIDVSATPPANAVGNVTYTWLIQEDPFTIFTSSEAIDTGLLAHGESSDLTFEEPGFYEFGHCDPHPWMTHSVAVVEGYEGPEQATVHIVEGDLGDQDTWTFVPQHLTIAPGTTVTYTNLGQVEHTASVAHEGEAVPVPQLLDLKEASGTVTVQGSDWMNLVVIAEDEAGNAGYAMESIFVSERFAAYSATNSDSFDAVWPPELGPAPDGSLSPSDPYLHEIPWKGTVTLNLTVEDATETLNQVTVSFRELPSDAVPDPQVNFTSEPTGSATFTIPITTAIRDHLVQYQLVVSGARGAAIDYSVDVTVEYDYTPPENVDLPCPEPHYSMGHCG